MKVMLIKSLNELRFANANKAFNKKYAVLTVFEAIKETNTEMYEIAFYVQATDGHKFGIRTDEMHCFKELK